MAGTNLQMNWGPVAYSNGTNNNNSIVFTRIDSVDINFGGTLLKYSGDLDRYPTVIINNDNNPSMSLRSSDPGTVMTLVPGTTGVIHATHKDAAKVSGGDVVYIMINAVVESPSTSGSHAQFGTSSLSLQAYSSDGSTTPLSLSRS